VELKITEYVLFASTLDKKEKMVKENEYATRPTVFNSGKFTLP